MRQTARQCPFYISFIEKHSQIKIVQKELIQHSKAPRYRWETIEDFFHVAYFTIHSCQFESLALQHSCKSCQSIFTIWEIVGSCLKERALMCEPHNSAALRKVPCQTQLLLSSSCWVRQQCFVFRGLQIFDFSQQQVLKSSALWQSIVGWESSRKSSGCLPEPRGSRCPSFSNSLSLSHSRWTFHQFGKNMQKPITLLTLIYHPAVFSQKSEEKKTGRIGNNRFIPRFHTWGTVCWTQSSR